MPTIAAFSPDRVFQIRARGSTVGREVRGAVATFLTMAYILPVNSQILSGAGVPAGSAAACTALAAAACCLLMGFYADFPLATASGMGLNAFVAFTVARELGSWQAAMGLVVIDGVVVLLLVLAGLRETVMEAIPRDLRLAIGAGIGLFIAFIGLTASGIIVRGPEPGPFVAPGVLRDPKTLVEVAGLLLTAVLIARRVKGAILLGIVLSTALAFALGQAMLPKEFPAPSFAAAFHADVVGAVRGHGGHGSLKDGLLKALPLLLSLVMVDFFDTLGTATGVAEQAGLVGGDGRIPGLRRILIVDGVAASVGGLLGASSVTAYVESAAGVAEGARTGLHSVVVGLLFLPCVFLAPLAGAVPKEATAPALILVGFLMIGQVARVDFARFDTAIPAFITLLTIPLTYSIAHGIGLGFIVYVVIKLAELRPRDVHPMMYVVAAAFAAYFVWGKG